MTIGLTLSNLIGTLRDQFSLGKGGTHYLKRDGDDLKLKDVNIAERSLTEILRPFTSNVAAQERQGFPNRTDSSISRTDSGPDRTFTIQPAVSTFDFYVGDVKYTKSGADTKVWPDTEGLHYFYYDDSGVLQTTTTWSDDLVEKYALVALLYWDATNNDSILFADERHGITMSGTDHLYLHRTIRAAWDSGLGITLTNPADSSGNDNDSAKFAVANGIFWDEDIKHTITDGSPQDLSPAAQLPILHRDGASGDWRIVAADDFPLLYDGKPSGYTDTRAPYNQWTGSTWQLTEVGNNNFFLMHFFASNHVDAPAIAIPGQNEYATVGAAREGAITELTSLLLGNLPTPELAPIATVIFQTSNGYSNTPKARIRSTDSGDDYIDWRGSRHNAGGGSGVDLHGSTHTFDGIDPVAINQKTFTQAAHGIAQWKWVYNNAGTWTLSSGNILITHPIGLVTAVTTDTLTACFGGLVARVGHGLTIGVPYFADTSGDISTVPSIHWTKPVMVPVDADTLFVLPWRESPNRIDDVDLGADIDNYEPGNATIWQECVAMWIEPTGADRTIKGFKAPASHRYPQLKVVFNPSATYNLLADHENSSTAANDIVTEGGATVVIPPGGFAIFRYNDDSGTSVDKWFCGGAKTRPKVISATITADETELTPTGYRSAETMRLDADGDYTLHGWPAVGLMRVRHVNVDATNVFTYPHQSGSITGDAKALELPSGIDIDLLPGESIDWEYDVTTGRHRPSGRVEMQVVADEDVTPTPLGAVYSNTYTSSFRLTVIPTNPATQFIGAVFKLSKPAKFDTFIMRRTTTATVTMRFALYQSKTGKLDDVTAWDRIATWDQAWAGTGVLAMSIGSTVKLKEGYFVLLFGPTTNTNHYFDAYTVAAAGFPLWTRYISANTAPSQFETSISSASAAPATFDPYTQAIVGYDFDITPIIRMKR